MTTVSNIVPLSSNKHAIYASKILNIEHNVMMDDCVTYDDDDGFFKKESLQNAKWLVIQIDNFNDINILIVDVKTININLHKRRLGMEPRLTLFLSKMHTQRPLLTETQSR